MAHSNERFSITIRVIPSSQYAEIIMRVLSSSIRYEISYLAEVEIIGCDPDLADELYQVRII